MDEEKIVHYMMKQIKFAFKFGDPEINVVIKYKYPGLCIEYFYMKDIIKPFASSAGSQQHHYKVSLFAWWKHYG